jgi:hypothetical protein
MRLCDGPEQVNRFACSIVKDAMNYESELRERFVDQRVLGARGEGGCVLKIAMCVELVHPCKPISARTALRRSTPAREVYLHTLSGSVFSQWPISRPRQWRIRVNQTRTEVKGLRRSVNQCVPFDGSDWAKRILKRLNLNFTDRARVGHS